MPVIDLNRLFVPLRADGENIDWGVAELGRRYGGWLHWEELVTKPRVVLLAEAGSGKTEEFRLRSAVLRERGAASFFLRVEDLADGALNDGLTPEDEARFEAWLGGDAPGSFFLDSVDEARLNAKSFERALMRFRRGIGPALDRASVFISCRVSDWKGEQDVDLITSLLPVQSQRSSEEEASSVDELLLRAVFKDQSRPTPKNEAGSPAEEPVAIVRLAELDADQRAALARWAGVADVETFIREVGRQGLSTYAERPGDLLELSVYWKVHGRFASFAEMTRFAVVQKLAERDSDRRDAGVLTDSRAWEGAERVAAALTLGKSLTLRAPGQEPDPTLAAGAIDPADVLPDWTPSERAALLRRGVFTPATYGRVRFHHRATQEYLTAQWLRRALKEGCPRSEVMGLLFAQPYGIRTVVPSMRPAAAWLALADAQVCNEMVEREPLELLRHGDPGSLPLNVRSRLLRVYADREAAGEIPDGSVDHRSFWMFSDPALAPTIRDVWARNTDPSFRTALLSLVREAAIAECIDLAREQALDTAAAPHLRVMAITTLTTCGDQEGLAQVAEWLMSNPAALSSGDAAYFARHLFPGYLTRSDLIRLIDEAQPSRQTSVAGFPSDIQELWERCPPGERAAFLEGLADLCLKPPFVSDCKWVSAKHRRLARELAPIAAGVAFTLRAGPVPAGLVKAFEAVQRADPHHDGDVLQKLRDALEGRRDIKRELFWLDVQEARRNREEDLHWWQLRGFRRRVWVLTVGDAEWLMECVRDETSLQDRRLALTTLLSVLGHDLLHARTDELRAAIDGVPELESVLAAALSPRAASAEIDVAEQDDGDTAWDDAEADARQFWIDFAARIRTDSSHLRDPARLADWAYARDLSTLTEWLSVRTGEGQANAVRQWPLLSEAFGGDVANAYRAGMKLLWRQTVPRPVNREDQESDVFDADLSLYAVGLEADEGEGWADRLTGDEAERAVLHAFSVRERSPEWIEELARAYPKRVRPIIEREVAAEWAASSRVSLDVALDGIVQGSDEYSFMMADIVIDQLRERPGRIGTFDKGIRVVARLPSPATTRAELIEHAKGELRVNEADEEWALRQLALLFTCSLEAGVESLEWWLAAAASDEERKVRGERAFGALFSRHWPLLPRKLNGAPVAALQRLTRLAYRTVRAADDVRHDGSYTPNRRDHAESARSQILDALLNCSGRATYEALRELADDPGISPRRKRFLELAHHRAEKDAELPVWSAADVVAFEQHHAAPAKTGADLLRIARAILDDIRTEFLNADASSRQVLASATDEEGVQNWLAEQFRLRDKQRFHVLREAEVADRKEPDILLASTAAAAEVAIEIKHGRRWTVRQLEDALRGQLARDYLRPQNRRYGLLVITHHGNRTRRDPDTKAVLNFEQLLTRLRGLAATLQSNESGPIEVDVVGIDTIASSERPSTRR